MVEKEITKEDVLFYLDMIDSSYGPSYKPKIGKFKPYYQLLKKRDSEDYNRFICVYQHYSNCLQEREKTILDLHYGVESKVYTLIELGEHLGISSSRVAQIRNKAERRIAREIQKFLKPKKPKELFETVIAAQSDEILVKMGREIRSYETIVELYFNQKYPDYYKNRRKLEELLIHLWRENELDHRQKAIKVLNMDREDVYQD